MDELRLPEREPKLYRQYPPRVCDTPDYRDERGGCIHCGETIDRHHRSTLRVCDAIAAARADARRRALNPSRAERRARAIDLILIWAVVGGLLCLWLYLASIGSAG